MYRPLITAGEVVLFIPPIVWLYTQAYNNLFTVSGSAPYGKLIAIGLLTAVYFEYSIIQRYLFERRAVALGCQPAKWYPHKDPVLGLDLFRDTMAALKANRLQARLTERFRQFGETYWCRLLGSSLVMTNEPENVKMILSTHFEDFHIAGPRLYALLPPLGPRSIFNVNGEEWRRTRHFIRPSFVRNQVADFACFDRHIADLLNRIPKDGSTFNIQELIMGMTMDSSTDFMYGFSIDIWKIVRVH